MFVLCRLRSMVRLPPDRWSRPLPEALKEELNRRLANTVLHKVGLVVCVFDLLDIGHSYLIPGDGAHHTKVTFRAIVFRPFVEEVLIGRVKSCTPTGASISLGFFDDIVIPAEALQHPYRFDDAEQAWVWEYPTDEGTHDLYMDPGEEVRFRVTAETFVDTSPVAPSIATEQALRGQPNSGLQGHPQEEKKVPYLIHASVNEPGLGLLKWWNS